MASRREGPRSPESADSHARVMTQKRLFLSNSLVWAGVILACAVVPKGNSDFIGVGVLLVLLSGRSPPTRCWPHPTTDATDDR
jgi:hypothetical protein